MFGDPKRTLRARQVGQTGPIKEKETGVPRSRSALACLLTRTVADRRRIGDVDHRRRVIERRRARENLGYTHSTMPLHTIRAAKARTLSAVR